MICYQAITEQKVFDGNFHGWLTERKPVIEGEYMNQGKKVYIEMIRIIAVVCIIFNHTDGTQYYRATSNIVTWLYSMTGTILCRMGVPLFFMISGALLLEKKESVKQLFRKRIGRIVVVLLGVSLFYYSMDIVRYGMEKASIADFVEKFLTNGIRESLWFLYAYLGMLMILPFFQKMILNIDGALIKYLLLLKVVYDIGMLSIQIFFQVHIYLDLGFVGDNICYMILGWYLDKDPDHIFEKLKTWKTLLFLVASIVINIVIMYVIFRLKGQYDVLGFDLLTVIMVPCFWLLVKKVTDNISQDGRTGRTILNIGSCVFGIYLLDNFCRWQWLSLYLKLCEKTVGVVACSAYVGVVFLTGLLYSRILRRLPIVKKYI